MQANGSCSLTWEWGKCIARLTVTRSTGQLCIKSASVCCPEADGFMIAGGALFNCSDIQASLGPWARRDADCGRAFFRK